jgi:hypothetical protein
MVNRRAGKDIPSAFAYFDQCGKGFIALAAAADSLEALADGLGDGGG